MPSTMTTTSSSELWRCSWILRRIILSSSSVASLPVRGLAVQIGSFPPVDEASSGVPGVTGGRCGMGEAGSEEDRVDEVGSGAAGAPGCSGWGSVSSSPVGMGYTLGKWTATPSCEPTSVERLARPTARPQSALNIDLDFNPTNLQTVDVPLPPVSAHPAVGLT